MSTIIWWNSVCGNSSEVDAFWVSCTCVRRFIGSFVRACVHVDYIVHVPVWHGLTLSAGLTAYK